MARVIVFSGTPGEHCVVGKPEDLRSGMNTFLKSLDVTYRPRINKLNSVLDREQKMNGNYFFCD